MSDVDAKRRLREYLDEHGFCAYPREMYLGWESYYFCDVVGYKDGFFYAFEIKQKGDNIPKALKQLEAYSNGVHYCLVVVDKISFKQLHKFKNIGYGVWKTNGTGYDEIAEPKLLKSDNTETTERKFANYCLEYKQLKRIKKKRKERMKDQKLLSGFA